MASWYVRKEAFRRLDCGRFRRVRSKRLSFLSLGRRYCSHICRGLVSNIPPMWRFCTVRSLGSMVGLLDFFFFFFSFLFQFKPAFALTFSFCPFLARYVMRASSSSTKTVRPSPAMVGGTMNRRQSLLAPTKRPPTKRRASIPSTRRSRTKNRKPKWTLLLATPKAKCR